MGRDLRNKLEGLDLARRDSFVVGGAFLGQVFDGGKLPSAGGYFYLVHPVEVGVQEESQTPTFTVDSTQAIPVAVIGQKANVGDMLVCEYDGQRWFSVLAAATTTTGDCVYCGTPCSACGGVKMLAGGTITDSNGTHSLIPYTSGGWGGIYITASITYSAPDCIEFIGSTPGIGAYKWIIQCVEGGKIKVLRIWYDYINLQLSGTSVGPLCYRSYWTEDSYAPASLIINPVCNTDTVDGSGSVSFSPPLDPTWTVVDEPPRDFSFSIPIESYPTRKQCCSPCPIPKVDLTIKEVVTGGIIPPPYDTGTLTYHPIVGNSPATWIGGPLYDLNAQIVSQLMCDPDTGIIDFSTSIYGIPTGERYALASYTCKPFHLEYHNQFKNRYYYIDGPADETDLGCDECGTPCNICGTVKLEKGETITDANGTWSAHASFRYGAGTTTGIRAANIPWITYHDGVDWDCCGGCLYYTEVDVNDHYYYSWVCDFDRGIRVYLYYPYWNRHVQDALNLPNPCNATRIASTICGFNYPTDYTYGGGFIYSVVEGTVTTTCDGNNATSVATFSPPTDVCGNPVPIPVTTATMTIPINKPKAQICCSPCPIPKKDLTLSIPVLGMSGTLVYTPASGSNPDQWAGCAGSCFYSTIGPDGNPTTVTYWMRFIMKCTSGVIHIEYWECGTSDCKNTPDHPFNCQGIEPPYVGNQGATCDPFHVNGIVQGGALLNCANATSLVFYIDE